MATKSPTPLPRKMRSDCAIQKAIASIALEAGVPAEAVRLGAIELNYPDGVLPHKKNRNIGTWRQAWSKHLADQKK